MAHLFQVGVGSGGIAVLDLVARDPRVTGIALVELDVYSPHNVHRHLFPPSAVGRLKADLAAEWVKERRPDVNVESLVADLTDPGMLPTFERLAAECDVGICAVDNEAAKFAFDAIMRNANKPWTLGEVLSGGIGGWVHRFAPDGPCYGCVASYLQRHVAEAPAAPPPDYANADGPVIAARIPASRASIGVIAGLHALMTLEMLDPSPQPPPLKGEGEPYETPPSPLGKGAGGLGPDFTSFLFALARVPGVFEAAYRPHRFSIPKSAACLFCSSVPAPVAGEDLDVALDQALARLAHE